MPNTVQQWFIANYEQRAREGLRAELLCTTKKIPREPLDSLASDLEHIAHTINYNAKVIRTPNWDDILCAHMPGTSGRQRRLAGFVAWCIDNSLTAILEGGDEPLLAQILKLTYNQVHSRNQINFDFSSMQDSLGSTTSRVNYLLQQKGYEQYRKRVSQILSQITSNSPDNYLNNSNARAGQLACAIVCVASEKKLSAKQLERFGLATAGEINSAAQKLGHYLATLKSE